MNKIRILSLLLTFALVFTSFTGMTFAASNILSSSSTDNIALVLSEESVPETISYENALQQGHIERLFSQEQDLNTAIFKNNDGTNTMYIFDEDIKYVDSYGIIQDKSNKLTSVKNGYRNIQNDINVFYPLSPFDGITVSFDDYSISFKPISISTESLPATLVTSTRRDTADAIEYTGVFGDDSRLIYTQTFSGVKEEIILNKPINTTKFSFEVTTVGLNLSQNENSIDIIKATDKSPVAIMSPLFLIDNNGIIGMGDYSISLSTQKNSYILTIDASNFLSNPQIEYPVIIDPSITVGSSSSTAIEDATIFTDYSTNFGTWYSLFVGDYDVWFPTSPSPRGTARTLVKFPGLMDNTTFQSLYEDDLVHSIKYNFADIDCGSGPNVINAYRMTRSWSESTVVYSSSLWSSFNSTLIGDTVISQTTPVPSPYPRYEIDITDAVDLWQAGTSNYGIMLKASDESLEAVVLGASESGSTAGLTSSRPYVVVNYGNYRAYVNNHYDMGYPVYNSLTSSQAQTEIKDYYEDISATYFNLLGLNLVYDSSNNKEATYYASPIDDCKGTVTSSNINTLCSDTLPCTDRDNVISDFNPSSGNNTTTNVYWSGHRIKSTATNGTINYNRSCSVGTRIILINRTASIHAAVLLHELNHQYAAKDHYHELADSNDETSCKFKATCSECGTNPRPATCVMNSTSIDITASSAICSGCRSEILVHLADHHQ